MNQPAHVPLDRLPVGSQAVVRQLCGGKELANRLAAMGLSLGSSLKVLQNRGQGPVLVLVLPMFFGIGGLVVILIARLRRAGKRLPNV